MRPHLIKHILWTFGLCLLFSCQDSNEFASGSMGEGEAWIRLDFGQKENVVMTRAHLSYASESMIHDIMVFIFDGEGNKIYDKWFTAPDLVDQADFNLAENRYRECWFVNNADSEGNNTAGSIRIRTPRGTGLSVYLITNLDTDRVRASYDLLSSQVQSLNDLQNFKLFLNVDSSDRTNKFTSTGGISGVNIAAPADGGMTGAGTISLKRCDAKINFVFRMGDRPDENGQTIKYFKPEKWKIVNLPRYCYALEQENDASNPAPTLATENYAQYAADFFDTDWKVFEDYQTNTSGSFAFYMMENRLAPKKAISSYQQRSKQNKMANGLNLYTEVEYTENNDMTANKTMRNFEYANDFSTYVLVKGTVEMDLVNDDAGQVLGAEVEYLIHLGGDWTSSISPTSESLDVYSGGIGSFDTERNHSYNYIVTINSVNNIRVEVETSDGIQTFQENQPGAWGNVTIAKEDIALCDAHYVSKTLTFHASNLVKEGISLANELTWSVSTPFSEGTFVDLETTPLAIFDYKWVHFRLNKKDAAGIYYENKRRKYISRTFASSLTYRTANQNLEGDGTDGLAGYHNDGLMDIVGLIEYIQNQAELFARYQRGDDATNMSDFDNTSLAEGGPKISVTVFVDEFFYEQSPLSGIESPTLWKRFINTNDRYMHILCDSYVSYDHDSRATGSVITIQQKAIQSIYNINESNTDLIRAWGLEHEDEFPDVWEWSPTAGAGNTSNDNGYLNTLRLWGLCGQWNTTYVNDVQWEDFMDFEVENEVPQLNDEHLSLRYSCMTRNRDNNGNGIIDKDEVRWYTASIGQLTNMYLGENCISASSRLYNRSANVRHDPASSTAQWMQHVCSSTSYNSNSGNPPTIVWAEEGIATGNYTGGDEGAGYRMSVRCVRNLGMDILGDGSDDSMTTTATDLVTITERTDGGNIYLVFGMENLMPISLRDYVSNELPLHFETHPMNLLSDRFEAYYQQTNLGSNYTFQSYNDELDRRILENEETFCPEGYRTPNQKEVAVMSVLSNITGDANPMLTRTAWSMGYYQTDASIQRVNSKYGFVYSGGNITLWSGANINNLRCVRDIRVR